MKSNTQSISSCGEAGTQSSSAVYKPVHEQQDKCPTKPQFERRRVYAIGDVQGCYEPLQRLLSAIDYQAEQDELWFAGDLINRGPQSLETLRFIRSLPNTKIVLGNHDLHLIAAHYGHGRHNKKDTLDEILQANDADTLINWLKNQPLMHYDAEFNACLFHAGLVPEWDLQQALACAQEAEQVLRDDKQCRAFIAELYGDSPNTWQADLKGHDRIRFIINVFTRTRFINKQSHALDLKTKSKLKSAPATLAPWFSLLNPSFAAQKTRILFGHWAALEGVSGTDGVEALDTGCVWGGSLTALRLNDLQRFSVAAQV